MLASAKLVAFIAATDLGVARQFYEGVLGLRVTDGESPAALVLDAHGTMLRVTLVNEHHPAPFTVLGWEVDSIEDEVDRLVAAGVAFVRYGGMNDGDPRGVWTAPGGARVAWFHDPASNLLSLTEFPRSATGYSGSPIGVEQNLER